MTTSFADPHPGTSPASAFSPGDAALLRLLERLEDEGYEFVTPTPATHARVLARRTGGARDLRDILGWSLPFTSDVAPAWLIQALEANDLLERCAEGLKSRVRVSRLRGGLFLHSAYPTDQSDSVFLGPDSYRFADFLARELDFVPKGAILDVGGGAGVGAITAARLGPDARVSLSDVNPFALRLARINAAHAGVRIEVREADGLQGAPQGLAAVLANPPYMADSEQTYRDGGDEHGAELSLDWAKAGLAKLAPGGRVLLYTGSAIQAGGADRLKAALSNLSLESGAELNYRELDPDVFGEELERPQYADVERIAVVGAVLRKPAA